MGIIKDETEQYYNKECVLTNVNYNFRKGKSKRARRARRNNGVEQTKVWNRVKRGGGFLLQSTRRETLYAGAEQKERLQVGYVQKRKITVVVWSLDLGKNQDERRD